MCDGDKCLDCEDFQDALQLAEDRFDNLTDMAQEAIAILEKLQNSALDGITTISRVL